MNVLSNSACAVSDADRRAPIWLAALNTAMFVPSSVPLGPVLARALDRRIRFAGLSRTAIFVPFVTSAASTDIHATDLFSPEFGPLKATLRTRGLPPRGRLEDPKQAMVVIAVPSLRRSRAFTTVIFLAALPDSPANLVEATRIDG